MLHMLLLLVVAVLIAGIGYWAVTQLGRAFGLPAPVVVVAQVLIVIVAVVYIVQRAGIF